jgi:large subunit ribosomal protein L4e
MKLPILDAKNKKVGEYPLPKQFEESIRPDVIGRAVLAMRSRSITPYGSKKEAGMRSSARLSKRRKDYRGSYGFGISRTPRKILSRSGTRMNWVGAFAPNTVGGRRAHPPKSRKIILKVNKKERKMAIRSGIAATIVRSAVEGRGHYIPKDYPFIVDDTFTELSKAKDVILALKSLGFDKELARVERKKFRSGKGKSRGRKKISKIGPLIVISKKSKVTSAASNIPGVDVVSVQELNAEVLAPGQIPGRLTLWTKGAISALEKDNLFR